MQAIKSKKTNIETVNSPWRNLYKVGGIAALGTVLVGLVEIGITFLPGGNSAKGTIFDWFTHFQNNPFMGLRDLGLLNLFFYALDIPIFLRSISPIGNPVKLLPRWQRLFLSLELRSSMPPIGHSPCWISATNLRWQLQKRKDQFWQLPGRPCCPWVKATPPALLLPSSLRSLRACWYLL